jgi:hypothetical protein
MRRRALLATGAAVLLLIGFAALRLAAPRPRLTDETYHAIDAGMSESDVVAILGSPAGDYCSPFFDEESFCGSQCWGLVPGQENQPHGVRVWKTDAAWLTVAFDENGRVCGVQHEFQAPPAPLLRKLRRWLRL